MLITPRILRVKNMLRRVMNSDTGYILGFQITLATFGTTDHLGSNNHINDCEILFAREGGDLELRKKWQSI